MSQRDQSWLQDFEGGYRKPKEIIFIQKEVGKT